MLLLGWLRCVVSSFQNRPSLRLGHLRHLLLLTRMRLLQVPRNVTAARHARLLLLTMVSTARTLLLLVGHRRNSDRIRMMAHSRMLLLLRWLLLMLGVGDLRWRALLLHRRRRRMLSHEGTQIALLLLGETCGGVVQAAEVSEDVRLLLLVDATFSFPVGGGGVADGAGKLFVFLFGSHFAQNGRWREG